MYSTRSDWYSGPHKNWSVRQALQLLQQAAEAPRRQARIYKFVDIRTSAAVRCYCLCCSAMLLLWQPASALAKIECRPTKKRDRGYRKGGGEICWYISAHSGIYASFRRVDG